MSAERGHGSKSRVHFLGYSLTADVGHGVGQEKAVSQNGNLRKAKVLEIRRFRGLLVRREGFEPPAFWSVGCLTHKSESFRLQFVLFTTVRSADFPLFPSNPARSNPVLGQKWVKENFTITNFEYAVYLLVYEILFFFSLSIKPVNKEETNTTVV